MRLRNIKNAKEKLEKFQDLLLLNPFQNRDKWQEIFKNSNPIHLEIGMGKGKFILEHALRNPDINYLGLEVSSSVMLRAARKISTVRPTNLYLINVDASELNQVFEKGEVAKIYLNFSDPWPKKRHEKRRLTSENFLKLYQEILIENGEIELKTDNQNFFEYSLISLNNFGFKFLEVTLNLHENSNEEIITTEYEEKFKQLGKIIYYLKVMK